MFSHNKRLQYTVRVNETNPGLANLMLEQFGGPQGELAAACRYFTQYLAEEDPGRRDMLIDIATEELSHLEVIGTIVAMLNRGAKGQLSEAMQGEAELYRSVSGAGNDSHVTQVLYGGGPALVNSGGVPWTAAYVDTIGDPTCDLRSNIAAESRAKIIYERLVNCTDDPGVKDALTFLMTREISHQLSFEKALYSIEPNFPPGKLPGKPEFANVYFNMSRRTSDGLSAGDGNGGAAATGGSATGTDGDAALATDRRGPWNAAPAFDYQEGRPAVDGGSGGFEVQCDAEEGQALQAMKQRLASRVDGDPITGAELGSTTPASGDGAGASARS
ncbi:MAG: manganese catalase family protein [Burkholderiales bacterium]|nr:manganese catalase family protein [Burkholderiales bacterium]